MGTIRRHRWSNRGSSNFRRDYNEFENFPPWKWARPVSTFRTILCRKAKSENDENEFKAC